MTILGIDEVGRGPWAGPLVVGAVILGPDFAELPEYDALNDSKKLTAKKREKLAEVIQNHALATGLGWVPAPEIDRYGLGPSLKIAARRAVKELSDNITFRRDTPPIPKGNILTNDGHKTATTATSTLHVGEIIIDGTINLLVDTPLSSRVTLLPKADALVKEVSAASILAKVARDQYMANLVAKYPDYGFEKHVGYGTSAHKSALLNLGPCPEHRFSFRPVAEIATRFGISPSEMRPSSARHNSSSTNSDTSPVAQPTSGQSAELSAISYLKSLGHEILAHNYKTKTYEIDIISIHNDNIYFTEVKYRQDARHGSPLEQITAKKRDQITYAAKSFLISRPELHNLQPHLAAASVSGPDFKVDDWFPIVA